MRILVALSLLALCACTTTDGDEAMTQPETKGSQSMKLGAFSVSLAVKDIAASRTFYEKLGFESVMGEPTQNWLILKNGEHVIGLFQGMFENNIMTFNPGWDQHQNTPENFEDVREIQRRLIEAGIEPVTKAEEGGTGPASFVLVDPDGNTILVDQHVPAPNSSN